jgi:hypothetical protein
MPFVDTNDKVFLGEKSFATWHEALDRYETLPCTRILPGQARRAAKTVCPDAGVPDGREDKST